VGRVAAERGVSPQRVALAWLLSLSDTVLPIPGARRPETILDSVAAAELELTADELAAIGDDAGVSASS
jgi:aryl-alcohol dehydrogenase-like predicted oxidoreductase